MAAHDAPVTSTAVPAVRTTRTAGRGTRFGGKHRGSVRIGGAMAALALGAAACGGSSGNDGADVEIDATPAALAEVAQRSASQPYRLEASLVMRAAAAGEELDVDAPFMTGAVDGDASDMRMDMGEWLDQLAAADPTAGLDEDLDLTMHIVGDAETAFIQAPMFASLADTLPPGDQADAFAEFDDLGDRWGRVDLTALSDLPIFSGVQSSAGAPAGNDPRVLLDLVASADDVEALDATEIDGTEVEGLGANVSLGQMLEATGTEPDAFLDQMTGSFGATGATADEQDVFDGIMASVVETEIPFEVWVDDAGLVRQLSYEMNFADIFAELFSGAGDDIAEDLDEFTFGSTVDYVDYGDDGIDIEFPADAVDVTDSYRRILELGSPS